MDQEHRRKAKAQLVALMQAGYSWQRAAAAAGVQTSQSNAYRLWGAFRQRGEMALEDGRHGHPSKLRGEARTFLEEHCRQAPQTPSSTIQAALRERFDLNVSISQINRVRAALGVSNHSQSQEPGKKAEWQTAEKRSALAQPEWQEGAGNLLLLAAAQQTGLLTALETALSQSVPTSGPSLRLTHSVPTTLRRQLLTLLFLEAVGLRRTWDLRGYTGQALALLTGRRLAYGYRHIERFLAELAQAEADGPLTEALASWTATLWKPRLRLADGSVPVFYVDGHRKAVYADHLIPRGLVGRLGKILGSRALVVLHDQEGHPLLVTTHRGDQHLTIGLPAIIAHYEQAADLHCLQRVVVDREGMAAEFLAALASEGRTVVTVLRTDQYSGLESFRAVSEFVPLRVDRQGKVTREVALARFSLPLPEHPGQELDVRVALIRDLCRRVPDAKRLEDEDGQRRWDEKPDGTHEYWLDESWQATPVPAPPTVPKLIPIVTTAPEADAVELAQTYTRRWPAQENAIRDWLIPLGIDVNHGFAKTAVINSEVAKKREALQRRLDNVQRWADGARKRIHNASKLYRKRCQLTKERADAL
jgi:transposase